MLSRTEKPVNKKAMRLRQKANDVKNMEVFPQSGIDHADIIDSLNAYESELYFGSKSTKKIVFNDDRKRQT